ncbi:transglycosylase domain-containing protein [Chachezhania sediminis]|uniref:transglycosylase domain-containing protein n=1 Tax=Chachezhania sediminis TaxID=2599291 RepID=UPI00131C5513|nr:transglycosylase domain-containing protein [Chachezhania sediminis]
MTDSSRATPPLRAERRGSGAPDGQLRATRGQTSSAAGGAAPGKGPRRPGNGQKPAPKPAPKSAPKSAAKTSAKPPAKAGRRSGGGGGSGNGGGKGGSGGRKRGGGARKGPLATVGRAIGRFFGFILRVIWGFFWRISLIMAAIIGIAVAYVYATLPDASDLLDGRARGSVTMLDHNGDVFAWRGDQYAGAVTVEQMSPYMGEAVVATEDRRFYSHFGVDPRGIASAVAINLREGRGPLSGHGGSTITQQTAKLLCLGEDYDPSTGQTEAEFEAACRETTMVRKVKEAIFAMAMEAKYTKNEILTIYMNRAFLGAGARGFEAASRRYFDKSGADVTPAEAAMLAGLLVAPTRYAPTASLERAQRRASVIVGLMEDQGYLTKAQAEEARAHPAVLSEAAAARAGGYFADWVMSTGPDFFTRKTTEDVIIRTTLDPHVQAAAEEAMQIIFQEKVSPESQAQAAIVVMSPDGAVRAMVGGRETRVSGAFNRATQAVRQPGSSFKPFIYATALELGYSPLDTVVDEPFCMNIPGSGQWCPDNYTHKHYGRVTLTEALKKSLNIPAIKISESVGRDMVRKVAGDFGIASDLADGPSLALGVSESTLLEMTGAFAGILNGGSSVTPYGLEELRLQGDDAPLIGASGGMGERVIRQEAAEQLVWMMEKVVSEGTGGRAKLPGWEAAGKTGTSQSSRDAWFIGFTADYVTGVWMGYDDNSPLKGVTGGGLPAEIWRETMIRAEDGRTPRPLPMRAPEGASQARDPDATTAGGAPQGSIAQGVDKVLRSLFGGDVGAGSTSGFQGGDR